MSMRLWNYVGDELTWGALSMRVHVCTSGFITTRVHKHEGFKLWCSLEWRLMSMRVFHSDCSWKWRLMRMMAYYHGVPWKTWVFLRMLTTMRVECHKAWEEWVQGTRMIISYEHCHIWVQAFCFLFFLLRQFAWYDDARYRGCGCHGIGGGIGQEDEKLSM